MNAIILGQGNPYLKNPYLSKLSRVLADAAVPYEFWVWHRDDAGALPRVRVLLRFGGWGGGAVSALGYALWVALLSLRIGLRPRAGVYFCSRLDAALPCALVSLLRRCDYVFLDRDKLSKSYRWPAPVKRAIERIEGLVGRRALLHVLPGESRADGTPARNVRIVRNTPHGDVVAQAREIAAAGAPRDGRLRVLVSGLISPERGSRMMLAAVEALAGTDVEFVAAGRLLGEHAQRLAQHLGPGYHGIVGNEQALALLLGCDLVLAFYDPSLEINRLAEPNKWFDCAALGVPFVTNHGLQTSAPFEREQACFLCRYDDDAQLQALLLRLAADRDALRQRRDGLARLRYATWDTAMSQVVAECARLAAADRTPH